MGATSLLCVNEGLQVQRFDDFFHRFRRFMQLGDSCALNGAGTLYSTPPRPTMAGIESTTSSSPYSPFW